MLEAAGALGVPVKRVASKELDAMAHGATHGGVLAVCSAKPLTREVELIEMMEKLPALPMLLLLEGVEDARNLGFTLRSAEALGAFAVLIKKHVWDFDPVEVARPASGAYERMPLVKFENVGLIEKLRLRGMRLLGCIAGTRRTIFGNQFDGGDYSGDWR